ncbi:lysostaphin resistance A-like protein [Frigoribacterium sp. R86507]|uniref:lysostaphin resistance A-like protein n=1 Tax=Frigoribacterium sp. R86507 TaxID=3093850 RepID=UPI0037C5B945
MTTFAYHRLFRSLPSYRWWKPLLAAVVAVVTYLLASVVVYVGVLGVTTAVGGTAAGERLQRGIEGDALAAADPLVLFTTLASIAVMLPAIMLGALIVGPGAVGGLWSVAGRLRWRWLARCVVPGLAFMAVTVGLSYVVAPLVVGESLGTGPVTTPGETLVWAVAVILVVTPFQATAEEYAFRGLAMQTLGSWVAFPVVAVVLPTVAFAFAHDYNPWGMLDVAVFGVAAAYLTWRTGGLEAAIVAHVLNNTVLFLLSAPFAGVESSDGSPLALAVTVVSTPLYVWLVLRAARRTGLVTVRSAPLVPSAPPADDRPQEARVG